MLVDKQKILTHDRIESVFAERVIKALETKSTTI